jgi:hypothetical protein
MNIWNDACESQEQKLEPVIERLVKQKQCHIAY